VSELHRDPSAFGSGIGHLALVPVHSIVNENTDMKVGFILARHDPLT